LDVEFRIFNEQENEEAASSKGSASVSLAVSCILRDTFLTPGRAMRPRSAESFGRFRNREGRERTRKMESNKLFVIWLLGKRMKKRLPFPIHRPLKVLFFKISFFADFRVISQFPILIIQNPKFKI
jgi:hypothetical protein